MDGDIITGGLPRHDEAPERQPTTRQEEGQFIKLTFFCQVTNLNSHTLKILSRYCDPQPQVGY